MTSALRTRKRWRRKQFHQSSLEGFMFGNVEFQSRQIGGGGWIAWLTTPSFGHPRKKRKQNEYISNEASSHLLANYPFHK